MIGDFRPRQKGLAKVLGRLEAVVMEAIWVKRRASVRDVCVHLRRERDIAYTTVMTILNRLVSKGMLIKERNGLAFVYLPTCTREEFEASVAKEVIDGLLEDYSSAAYSHFFNRLRQEDEEAVARLEKMISERQRGD